MLTKEQSLVLECDGHDHKLVDVTWAVVVPGVEPEAVGDDEGLEEAEAFGLARRYKGLVFATQLGLWSTKLSYN